MKDKKNKVNIVLKRFFQSARWKKYWPKDTPAEVLIESSPYPWECDQRGDYSWQYEFDIQYRYQNLFNTELIRNGKIDFKLFEIFRDIYESNKNLYDRIYLELNYTDNNLDSTSILPEIIGERYETDVEFKKRIENENREKVEAQKEKQRKIREKKIKGLKN